MFLLVPQCFLTPYSPECANLATNRRASSGWRVQLTLVVHVGCSSPRHVAFLVLLTAES